MGMDAQIGLIFPSTALIGSRIGYLLAQYHETD